MPSYVYLLSHPTQERFKVGKAVDVPARISQLGADQFDLSKSHVLVVSDEDAANNLERLLHRAFLQWRYDCSAIVIEDGARREGASEWFDLSCKNRLLEFVAQNRDLLQCSLMLPDELQALVQTAVKQKRLPGVKSPDQVAKDEQREQNRIARLARTKAITERVRNEFAVVINSAEPLLRAINVLSNELRFENSSYPNAKYLVGVADNANWGDISSLIESLMEVRLRCEFGGANVFPSISTVEHEDVVDFKIGMMWVDAYPHMDVIDEAIARLQSLDTGIQGWPTEVSAVPEIAPSC